jgi:hypothetical protein
LGSSCIALLETSRKLLTRSPDEKKELLIRLDALGRILILPPSGLARRG